MMRMVAFTLLQCATCRKLGIQKYKARAGRQIVMTWAQLGQRGGIGAHLFKRS
jgi:hypothetical protein